MGRKMKILQKTKIKIILTVFVILLLQTSGVFADSAVFNIKKPNLLNNRKSIVFPYSVLDFNKLKLLDQSGFNGINYVDDNNTEGPWDGTIEYPYQYIQDAINNTIPGGTVYVFNGTYYEILWVNKTINLIGEDKNNTIIDGRGIEGIIYVLADNVNISGFTIQNGGNTFWVDPGIYIVSDNNTIKDNYFTDIVDPGIFIGDGSNNKVIKNSVEKCGGGIHISGDPDLGYPAKNNLILGNIFTNSRAHGLTLIETCNNNISCNIITNNFNGLYLSKSNYNIIYNNHICSNGYFDGIWLASSHHNKIIKNNISNNTWDGIFLDFCKCNIISYNNISYNKGNGVSLIGFSRRNKITCNNFIENGFRNAILRTSFFNRWKKNYWDDWIGLEFNLLKWLPKRIPYGVFGYRLRCNYDWRPAREPYDIESIDLGIFNL
jgi:parallel beta-helix repeat protein